MSKDHAPLPDLKRGWLAGLIEGEGWLGERSGSPKIQVVMTDEDTVRRCRDWSGVGNVTGPYAPYGTQVKSTWAWKVTARDDAAWLISQIIDLLGTRRAERAVAVLDAYNEAGPTRGTASTCGYGHDISDGSPNLRLVKDGKYTKRRCLKCAARRQQEHRIRERARRTIGH